MRLYYLVTVDVDALRVVEDRPPEAIGEAVQSEIASALADSSARGALGITYSEVTTGIDTVVRDLRRSLLHYAKPNEGWDAVAHADAYEASRELIPEDES